MSGCKLCGVVFERDAGRARAALEGAQGKADICELRVDVLDRPDLERLLAPPRPPVIVTNRPAGEAGGGGGFRGSERERIEILRRALDLGAEYVDVEVGSLDRLPPDAPWDRVIASHHDPDATPSTGDLEALLSRLEATPAGVLKLVTTARSFEDNLRVMALPAEASRPLIALCMGEAGRPSRLLAPRFGGFLTFGALDPGAPSAPGQYTLEAMRDDFRLHRVGAGTSLYGILGRHIDYSLSPRVHNRAFEELGLDRAYLSFDVDDPAPLLAHAGELGLRGCSVTIPHKGAVAVHAASLDDAAREIGAVNTLVRSEGRWRAWNTDGPAVLDLLRAKLEGGSAGADPRLLILGAGGAARAVAWAARALAIPASCTGRTPSRAARLASDFGLEAVAWEERHDTSATIVCNTTPVGSDPASGETPFHASRSRGVALLFDTIYVRRWTPFLEEGALAGCSIIHGMAMFLRQAALQCRLFTGREDAADWFLERFAGLEEAGP